MADARYPIGKFSFEGPLSDDQRIKFLEDIEQAPARLKAAVKGPRSNSTHLIATADGPCARSSTTFPTAT